MDAAITPHSPAGIRPLRRLPQKEKNTRTQILSVGIIKNTDKKTTLRTHIPFALMLLAATLIILGLADPHIPLKELKEGVNVVIVIDDSGSMAATDYTPTRLEAAKSAAEILIRRPQRKRQCRDRYIRIRSNNRRIPHALQRKGNRTATRNRTKKRAE